MVHRLPLIFGGLGAAGVVALALALGGSPFPITGSVDAGDTDSDVNQLVEPTPSPSPTDFAADDASQGETVVDVVYIETPTGNRGSGRIGSGRADAQASVDPTASPGPTGAPRSAAADSSDDRGHDDRDHDDRDDDDHGGRRHGGGHDSRGRDHHEDD